VVGPEFKLQYHKKERKPKLKKLSFVTKLKRQTGELDFEFYNSHSEE
jgi:hypothetical protein